MIRYMMLICVVGICVLAWMVLSHVRYSHYPPEHPLSGDVKQVLDEHGDKL